MSLSPAIVEIENAISENTDQSYRHTLDETKRAIRLVLVLHVYVSVFNNINSLVVYVVVLYVTLSEVA
jgi:hypothetical protein